MQPAWACAVTRQTLCVRVCLVDGANVQLNDRKIYDIQATKSLQEVGDQAAFDSMLAACQKLTGTIDSSVPVTHTLSRYH